MTSHGSPLQRLLPRPACLWVCTQQAQGLCCCMLQCFRIPWDQQGELLVAIPHTCCCTSFTTSLHPIKLLTAHGRDLAAQPLKSKARVSPAVTPNDCDALLCLLQTLQAPAAACSNAARSMIRLRSCYREQPAMASASAQTLQPSRSISRSVLQRKKADKIIQAEYAGLQY